MRLYLIRHGQSEANLKRIHSGWSPVHLTEQGKIDAQNAKKVLDGIEFDRVYSSDLVRARETCEIAMPQKAPILTHLLREIGVGEVSGKSVAECQAIYGEEYMTHRAEINYRSYGGESAEDQLARAKEFLKLLEEDPADTVAAFTHEGMLRTLRNHVVGAPLLERIPCGNGGVCVFEFDGKTWKILQWDLRVSREED